MKVKSLFWVHIQAQSSTLQTLTSTFPGHWAFTLRIHLDIHLNSLGSIQPLTCNLAPRLTNLPSQVPTLLLGREKQCSVKCLALGTTSRRTGRVLNSGLDLDPNPEPCTLPLDQLAAAIRWWLYNVIATNAGCGLQIIIISHKVCPTKYLHQLVLRKCA